MKKISRSIAMILVLVILAGSFTSCISMLSNLGNLNSAEFFIWGTLELALYIACIVIAVRVRTAEASPPDEAESQIYLTSADYNPLTHYSSLMERINSLPEAEMDSAMERFFSLPEIKRAYWVDTVYSLPETEIASSAEKLSALSDEELASLVQNYSALSDEEFDLLSEKLKEKARALPAVVAAVRMRRVPDLPDYQFNFF